MIRAALFALLALAIHQAQGHAYLRQPCSRNHIHNSNYEPQSLAAGGPGVVGAGAVWPNGKYGLCGDQYGGPRDHEVGGKYGPAPGVFGGVYEENSTFTARITVTAFHKGGWQLKLCRIGASESETAKLTQACFDETPLVPVGQSSSWSWFPVDGKAGEYSVQFKLPAGLRCTNGAKCVLQWHWVTGNSCNPPAAPAQYRTPQLPTCGTNAPYPEEFWNCADIVIYPKGSAPPTTAQCTAPPPAARSPAPPTSDPCEGKPVGTLVRNPSDCRQFLQCLASGPSAPMDCPAGTGFSESLQVCDWLANLPDCA